MTEIKEKITINVECSWSSIGKYLFRIFAAIIMLSGFMAFMIGIQIIAIFLTLMALLLIYLSNIKINKEIIFRQKTFKQLFPLITNKIPIN
jgi:hypothetical protein